MLADRMRMLGKKLKKLIDRTTPTTVVVSAYSTEGNGGRKLVRLTNGWVVAGVSSGIAIYLYVSKDFGVTFTQLQMIGSFSSVQGFSLASVDTSIFVILLYNNTTANCWKVDKDGYKTVVGTFDSTPTVLNNCSLTTNSQGTEIHTCWSSKNTTYPNSLNIRYCKGTINGDGSVAWGSVEQITSMNTTGTDMKSPSIVLNSNNNPIITYSGLTSTNSSIRYRYYNGSIWTQDGNTGNSFLGSPIFSAGTSSYIQSSPSACVDKDGVIHVTWYGLDSIHTTTNYIRYGKSLDGGVTWSTMRKLVPGINPSITTDKNGNIYIEYQDDTLIKRIKSTDNGVTWTTPEPLGVSNNPSTLYDNTFGLDFEVPLSIKQTSTSVIFSGKWYE